MPRKRERAFETLQGIGVSPGIAIAKALVLEGPKAAVVRAEIPQTQVPAEVARFRSAVRGAWRQLRHLRDRVRAEAGEAYARIFQAQILILKDRSLLKETVGLIRHEQVNAEWAFHTILGRYTRIFEQLAASDLKERATDIEDVETRVQAVLTGSRRPHHLAGLTEDVIVVAAGLTPSDAASLHRSRVIGLAIDGGGPTSHTAVIASALGVPAVAGLRDASARMRTGDLLALDGSSGLLSRNPSEEELVRWRGERGRLEQRAKELAALRDQPATTMDGVRIALRANIELPDEMLGARRHGAEGVGLYRSEFLYMRSAPSLPDEEEHYATYLELAEKALPHEVVIRTLDLGGEKDPVRLAGSPEANPVLGLRGVRFGLRHPDLFRVQLRAILRAAAHGRVRMMLPMVSGLEEVRQVRALLEEVRGDLAREGVGAGADLPLGVMIEIPAAALIAERLAAEVDFFSIGTNDLIQYALAIDRATESVSYLYQPLHPAILLMLRRVAETAARRGLRVTVCGEMAGDPVAAVALIGLGITELSMSPAAIPAVKQVIRSLSAGQARALVEEALRLGTAAEIEEMMRRRVLALLPAEYACPL